MTAIGEIDVVDRASYQTLWSQRERWLSILHDDPINSIESQIDSMQWRDVTWRTFNEARRYATLDRPTAAIAPALGAFIDQAWVEGQVIAISKLVDRRRNVISLIRLVHEVQQERSVFTRENYIAIRRLVYDPSPLRRKFDEVRIIGKPSLMPPQLRDSEDAHDRFDALSGVGPSHRQRTDRIRPQLFRLLNEAIASTVPELNQLERMRNEWVAHAAHLRSHDSEELQLTQALVSDIHQRIVSVAKCISTTLLHSPRSAGLFVSRPADNEFDHLDVPFVPGDRLPELEVFWAREAHTRHGWFTDAEKDLWRL